MFRFNASAETGYCGNYIISVNRNNVSGVPMSYTYSLVISRQDKINGYLINYTDGNMSNNQMTKLRIRTTTDEKLFIDGFICSGGNDTNTYYCGLTILHEKGKGSDSIVTYSNPEPITDNASDVIRWSTDIRSMEANWNLSSKQLGIFLGTNSDTGFEKQAKPVWTIRNYGTNGNLFIRCLNDETILYLFKSPCSTLGGGRGTPRIDVISLTTKSTVYEVPIVNIYQDDSSPSLTVKNVIRTSDNQVYARISSPNNWYAYILIATGAITPYTDIGDYTVIEEPEPEP